ncbi:hypothetical protein [Sphingomicrobium flavum]|uniref:hypothetical protein n=1 Tax=Sphingomicrobium flavum TaxID=1229164 RepID=UPI0021AE30E0|nr:hypothetical protein [Sphingomicrobium flavum]
MLKIAMMGLAGTLAVTAMATPAAAQRSQQSEIIVFGDDPCPRSTEDEIVVCKRLGEEERFRIPQTLRRTEERVENQSWSARARFLESQNVTGIPQCSAVGPGAADGCLQKEINDAFAKREQIDDDERAPE